MCSRSRGSTSVTEGRDLPLPHGVGWELSLPPRFRNAERVLVVEQCPTDSFLVDLDLQTGRKLARVGLACRPRSSAWSSTAQERMSFCWPGRGSAAATGIYVVRDGRAEQVANGWDCWKVAW